MLEENQEKVATELRPEAIAPPVEVAPLGYRRRARRQPGENCGLCISWTRGANPMLDPDPVGTCTCNPPSATAVPQQDRATGQVGLVNVTMPSMPRRSWWCQQFERDLEIKPPVNLKQLPNWK